MAVVIPVILIRRRAIGVYYKDVYYIFLKDIFSEIG